MVQQMLPPMLFRYLQGIHHDNFAFWSPFQFNKPVPSTTTTPAADTLKLMASKADSSQSSDKPTFGGFTFTSKPLVTEKKEEVTKKEEKESEAIEEEEAPKANPFASFSFSSTKTVNKPAESKSAEGTFYYYSNLIIVRDFYIHR